MLFYRGILVKDIFAHLLVPWVHQNLPQIKKVLLIRNPFDVALSKQKLRNWVWMDDPQALLRQKHLYDDYLAPHESFINQVGNDFIERQILIWAIIHYVLFQNLQSKDIHVIFYEDLVTDSTAEIQRLFEYLGKDWSDNEVLAQKILKPSRTSQNSSQSFSSVKLVDSWKSKLSQQQINKGFEILKYFELEQLYLDRVVSNKQALLAEKFAF